MSLVFFTDRDLGKKFPQILREAGLTVERHADHFVADTPDEQWLEAIGRHRWIAITHDGRIRYKPNELSAVMRHRVPLLVVIGHAPYPELAQAFVTTGRVFSISSISMSRLTSPRFIAPQPATSRRTRRPLAESNSGIPSKNEGKTIDGLTYIVETVGGPTRT